MTDDVRAVLERSIRLVRPSLSLAKLILTRPFADLAAGVRIAQQMGLHKLGSDPSTMPPEDPALPPGVNTLRREIPIRLFYVLLFLEYMNIRVRSGLSPALGEYWRDTGWRRLTMLG